MISSGQYSSAAEIIDTLVEFSPDGSSYTDEQKEAMIAYIDKILNMGMIYSFCLLMQIDIRILVILLLISHVVITYHISFLIHLSSDI